MNEEKINSLITQLKEKILEDIETVLIYVKGWFVGAECIFKDQQDNLKLIEIQQNENSKEIQWEH